LLGVKDELPILIGVIPFGLIYGVLALSAGIPTGAAQAMSSVVFAGSAQFVSAELIGSGAPALVIVMTASIVNLRHALYSASIAPYLKGLHPLWKWILAYLLTDEAYAVTITYYQRDSELADGHISNPGSAGRRHWYFLGAGLALWSTWQASTAAGIFLGAQVPSSWSLDFTLALTFIALVVPTLKDRAVAAAALVAGTTALLAFGLPLKLGLVAASLVGIIAGLWMEGRS
jgi:4-azaleucine resistance transporter AzlC